MITKEIAAKIKHMKNELLYQREYLTVVARDGNVRDEDYLLENSKLNKLDIEFVEYLDSIADFTK